METVLLEKINVLQFTKKTCTVQWREEIFTITSRYHADNYQLLTTDVHFVLFHIKQTLSDAFCVTAITMHDLYPKPSWNFVFGEASSQGVGVFSFVRYHPGFYFGDTTSKLDAKEKKLLVIRSCHVMVHEITHLFGIKHCCYFRCLMNGANHLEEVDSQPLHLCPMDLHKLEHVIGFNPILRYRRLLEFFEKYTYFEEEREWLSERLEALLQKK